MRLTITEDHFDLLNRMYIGWEDCEYGAPAVDCKRPYGNSYVEGDIGEILGIAPEDKENGYSAEQRAEFRQLHEEMQHVLQILVQHARTGIRLGATYERVNYKHWKCLE